MSEQKEIIVEICQEEKEALIFSSWPRYNILLGELGILDNDGQAEGSIAKAKIRLLPELYNQWEHDLWESWSVQESSPPPSITEEDLDHHIIFQASADDPFWLQIGTDIAAWIEILESHPYAQRLECEPEYARYRLPLSLLEIS